MSSFTYVPERADRAVNFFRKRLHFVKGRQHAGKPFELAPWQEDEIIRPLFGTIEDGTGLRWYREAFLGIPRKAGKTALGAGIALYTLTADSEPGAEVYSCAKSRGQARKLFEVASEMVRTEPRLNSRVEIFSNSLTVSATFSKYEVLSSDAGVQHGADSHAVMFDELHTQRTRELWDVMRTSTASRQQPIFFTMTTAGGEKHNENICYAEWERARKVRDGILTGVRMLPVIYEVDPEHEDWKDPATWARVNPNYPVTPTSTYLTEEFKKALESPANELVFKQLHLNIWPDTQLAKWIPMDRWMQCAGSVDKEALRGRTCYAGLDLSTVHDLSAFVLVFPMEDTYKVIPFFWVPESKMLERSQRDGVPYNVWCHQGFIEMTAGDVVDYDVIRKRINELSKLYNIEEIAYDRRFAGQIVTQLMSDGLTPVGFGQGMDSMSSPSKELIRLISQRRIEHGDNPVLRWMASNAVAVTNDTEDIKVVKGKSVDRIDGIVALIMALGRIIVQAAPRTPWRLRVI